ncbi:MAG: class I SAM-dependent methyltransferase [Steroidobacteraceae bacterium]
MTGPGTQEHWEGVYSRRRTDSVSWYEAYPAHSLEFIAEVDLDHSSPIIDIGGGASPMVDNLVGLGYRDITLLDVSEHALDVVRRRIGAGSTFVTMMREDVTAFRPERRYALWHDRAVFHFLTTEAARRHYIDALLNATAPGGHVIIATFGPSGPTRCSNLDTCRYDAAALATELGAAFQLRRSSLVDHLTPNAVSQQFLYTLFARR